MARKAFIERALGRPPRLVRLGLEGQRLFFKLSRLPGVGRRHPWVTPRKTDVRFIPINSVIEMPESCPMPLRLLDRLIEEASHRVIVDFCGCRVGYECKEYPSEIGCLLMGDSALEVPRTVCREVGVGEAKEHARRAVEAGLVPIVGKAHVDDFIYGIKDRGRLLTVCFCCECCSITRGIGDIPIGAVEPAFARMEGVSVVITEKCRGCGRCVERCFVKAIEIVDGRAVIGPYCRLCGRCASACPNGGAVIRIDDPDFLEKTYRRIRAHVKFD